MEIHRGAAGHAVIDGDTEAEAPAYEAVARDLESAGVRQVFGLVGDDTAKLLSALVARGMPFHDTRHENTAAAMAAGYAASSGELGVCVLSRGPGLTNGLTGVVNAAKSGAPLLVIVGDQPLQRHADAVGGPDGKALATARLGAACELPVFVPASAASVRTVFREALSLALTGATVVFALPRDLVDRPVSVAAPFVLVGPPVRRTPPPRQAALDAAAQLLRAVDRPLLLAGLGAWRAGAREAIVTLAERTGAVLATTLRAKDMFRGHPLDAGVIGSFSHTPARGLIEDAGCVVAFGASLNGYSTNRGSALPPVPVVHVDVSRSAIGRYHGADIAVVGDAKEVAERLAAALEGGAPAHAEDVRARLAAFDVRDEFEPVSGAWTIDPRLLVLELDRLLPADRSVVTDAGNFFGFVPTHLSIPNPDRLHMAIDFSAIGLGLGTALGVAVGRPDATTVLFAGDGSTLMTLGELETIARLDLPLVVVIMNDCAYGAERHYLELQGLPGSKLTFPDTDFAALAEAFGIESATVRRVDDVGRLAERLATRGGPLLLDCKVAQNIPAPFLSEALSSR